LPTSAIICSRYIGAVWHQYRLLLVLFGYASAAQNGNEVDGLHADYTRMDIFWSIVCPCAVDSDWKQ
jgi:hypothetical protein